ncbi:MAG: hypothetical protein QN141_08955 [Armatimonadota bacterium]|nr:hypothetical protein [Armatimonadota bacterium]MDR7451837.1 hypothetical protein [Armatimonadota bacterium]MDR7467562.1 hypothetical protein [Armatimonadota bacterium]MDR7494477.1 hypothetical protein [Armatimonadota bacterium]MDR7499738.1 hypothetical protein [Armatimonadota bacterium]
MYRLVVLVAVLLTAAPARAQQAAPEVVARNLAENVLGPRTVRSVRVSAGGRYIDIVWDAVLYRPAHSPARNREQLRGEAELATGSIMGVLRPAAIDFTMMVGRRAIARGRRTPEEFTITYAQELGG